VGVGGGVVKCTTKQGTDVIAKTEKQGASADGLGNESEETGFQQTILLRVIEAFVEGKTRRGCINRCTGRRKTVAGEYAINGHLLGDKGTWGGRGLAELHQSFTDRG